MKKIILSILALTLPTLVNAVDITPDLENSPAQIYTVDTTIAPLIFTNTVDTDLASCTSSPPLPTGLTVDTVLEPELQPGSNYETCEIEGTPTVVSIATTYTITATNSAGISTATVNITVNPPAPIIAFSPTAVTAVVGIYVEISAMNTGGTPTSYAISPAIANNLSFSTETGTISGTPTAVTVTTYTVTASNVTGIDSATIEITVNPPAPIIAFSPTAVTAVVGTYVEISAINTGGTPTSYAISPAIANNLSFSTDWNYFRNTYYRNSGNIHIHSYCQQCNWH